MGLPAQALGGCAPVPQAWTSVSVLSTRRGALGYAGHPPSPCAPSQIVTSASTDLQDYTYYFVPAPWLSVKLLRLLQCYPPPGNSRAQSLGAGFCSLECEVSC